MGDRQWKINSYRRLLAGQSRAGPTFGKLRALRSPENASRWSVQRISFDTGHDQPISVRGRGDYWQNMVDLLTIVPDLRPKLEEHATSDEFTVVLWTGRGTGPGCAIVRSSKIASSRMRQSLRTLRASPVSEGGLRLPDVRSSAGPRGRRPAPPANGRPPGRCR